MHIRQYKYKRISTCCFFLLLCFFFVSEMKATERREQEINNLGKIISTETNPTILIPALTRLSKLNEMNPELVNYQVRNYELATQIDSVPAVYASLISLANYYNNYGDLDSMLYWSRITDSIANSRNEYPDAWFYVKSLYCSTLTSLRDYEMAMHHTLEIYRLASEKKQPFGLLRSSECLGLIYRGVGRDSDAVMAYQEGLDLLDQYEEHLIKGLTISEISDAQMRILALQLESAFRAGMYEQAEVIAEKYKQAIKKQELLNETQGDVYPVKREYWLFHSLCLDLYVRENKLDKAKGALLEATKYNGNSLAERDYVILVYYFSLASYYLKDGNLQLALQYIDKILEVEQLPDELQLKANILKALGRDDEALVLYDKIYEYAKKQNNETFLRQINQLWTLHELNEKDARERELIYNSERMKLQQQRLAFFIVVIVVLLVVIYVLYIYYRHARRLKNELQTDKEELLLSENNLIREKIKADEASRMKSAFIANMSHEIRTPLNAIVGFSGLMIDESSGVEEKEEYTKIIKNNTELLLNLVNDVLDLSRMETGDMSFDLVDYPLIECCRKSLESVRHRILPEVELTFYPSSESIILCTDPLRLQQLLINLLGNAAKFTQKGEIRLAYELIDKGRSVSISVTDTGPGIPLEKQADIFKRFEKLDDYKPGAGLGLSICTIISERLGGTLSIDSTYAKGARFVFIHPCKQCEK